ncbi:hypothetical protein ACGF0J_28000 [Nonomuraea sp. NPDC047897]|uniref:hypothetical protein n=1 Tax=Nonomuraea sp. NPDC047897 TaxID=3364346 RepID=UPI003712BDC9
MLGLLVAICGLVVAFLAFQNDKAGNRPAGPPGNVATATPSPEAQERDDPGPLDHIGPVGVIGGTVAFLVVSWIIWGVWVPDSDSVGIMANVAAWIGYLWVVWPTVGWWAIPISIGSWAATAWIVVSS